MTESTSTGPTDGEEAGTEVEATLALVSEDPAGVAARIAGLDALGPYRFEWHGAEELRDVYLDTSAGELRERDVALRLRRAEDGWRITLKGPGRPAAGGGIERSELEVEWSPAGLGRALGALRKRGVELPAPSSDAGEEPVAALRGLGLDVVQDRRTLRRSARITAASGGGGGETLAWLSLDVVSFRTAAGRTVRHREVEVEAAPAAPEGLPGEVVGLLRRRLGDAVRPWEHPKLATGAAVEELDPPAGPDGSLRPAAYGLLESELAGGGGQGG